MEERRKEERRKSPDNFVELPDGVMQDRRKGERRGSKPDTAETEEILVFGDSVASSMLYATVMDISDSGVGLFSSVPFNVGQAIRFLQRRRKNDFPDRGVVIWTMKDADGFRAGVMFHDQN